MAKPIVRGNRFINRVGCRFGRLTVVRLVRFCKRGSVWLCRCDCGNWCEVRSELLGCRTNSCGCLKAEVLARRSTTHGMARRANYRTREYISWAAMKSRCHNPRNPCYGRYGGLGVRVCKRWLESFAAFFADMGPKPTPAHTIDRINPRLGYCPSNCRWLPSSEQSANRKCVLWIRFHGIKDHPVGWSKRTTLKPETIRRRYVIYGWSARKTLTTPIKGQRGNPCRLQLQTPP